MSGVAVGVPTSLCEKGRPWVIWWGSQKETNIQVVLQWALRAEGKLFTGTAASPVENK